MASLENPETTKEAALAAVSKDGKALKDLPQFRDDKDVVIKAVSQDGHALKYATPRLRGDEEAATWVVALSDKIHVYRKVG